MSDSNVYVVTGADGYIASVLVKRLVESGAHVRATVGRESSGQEIKKYLSPSGSGSGKLEIFIIPDITIPGAFKEVLEGATHMFHVAGGGKMDAEKDVLDPARAGTLTLLKDAVEAKIQRVVYTSSVAAIKVGTSNTCDETHWNALISDEAIQGLKSDDPTEAMKASSASKRVAEEAVWDFVRETNAFPLVTLQPVMVIGKAMPGESNAHLCNTLRPVQSENGTSGYGDIEHLVEAHIQAMKRDEANGKRFLLLRRPPAALVTDHLGSRSSHRTQVVQD